MHLRQGLLTHRTVDELVGAAPVFDHAIDCVVGDSLTVGRRRVAQVFALSRPVPELWVPRPCAFCKGGLRCCLYYFVCHAERLDRSYGADHLHFITCSCYRRMAFWAARAAATAFFRFWNSAAAVIGSWS